jgi:hypothetical protein
MNHRTEIVRLKIERADKHIKDLEADIRGFFDTKPYVVVGEREADTRRPIYRLAACSHPPVRFSLITGDILQNLRSALDHLIWQLVEAAGNNPGITNAFPICDSPAEYQSARTTSKVTGISVDAKKAIDATNPYHGGNEVLWKLHRLNNIDKHRLLITVGNAFRSVDIAPTLRRMGDFLPADFQLYIRPADRMFPLDQG